jgi:hypothetical protein
MKEREMMFFYCYSVSLMKKDTLVTAVEAIFDILS